MAEKPINLGGVSIDNILTDKIGMDLPMISTEIVGRPELLAGSHSTQETCLIDALRNGSAWN